MARPSRPNVGSDVYERWHARLLNADPEAAEGLAAMLHGVLYRTIRSRPVAQRADADAIGQAIDETIEHYLQSPTLFNPALGSLVNFLTKSVENRLKDWRIAEARRRRREGDAAPALDDVFQVEKEERGDQWPDLMEFAREVCTAPEMALLDAAVHRRSLDEKAAILEAIS